MTGDREVSPADLCAPAHLAGDAELAGFLESQAPAVGHGVGLVPHPAVCYTDALFVLNSTGYQKWTSLDKLKRMLKLSRAKECTECTYSCKLSKPERTMTLDFESRKDSS